MSATARRRVRSFQQTAATDCAPTCLAMLADYFGVDLTLAEIREALDPGRDGVTAYRIKQAAQKLGLQVRAFRVSAEDILTGEVVIESPCIAHWGGDHYVILEPGRNTKSIKIVDPAIGRRTIIPALFRAEMSGTVLTVEPMPSLPQHQPRPLRASLPSVVTPLLRRHWVLVSVLVLLTAILTGGGLVPPWASARIIDESMSVQSPAQWILVLAISLLLVAGVATVRGLVNAEFQRRFTADLGIATARRLFNRGWQYFERRSVGDLLSRVNSASLIHLLVGGIVLTALLDAALAIGYVVVLALWEPRIALITGLVMVLMTAVSAVIARRSATLQREELLEAAEADSLMVDALNGQASLRANAAEHLVLGRWEILFQRRIDLGSAQTAWGGIPSAMHVSLGLGFPVLVLALTLQAGHSIGVGVGLAAVSAAAIAPVGALTGSLLSLAEVRPLLERLVDLRDAPVDPTGTVAAPELTGRITASAVGFRYDRYAPWALEGIDLAIPAGSKIGIVGASGCGKSTLVSLLTGLHPPTTGQVCVDGLDLATLDPQSVRRQFGVVLQTNWLGRGTLREVVDMGRDLDDEVIVRALVMAGLGPDLRLAPFGLDTRLTEGEGGWSAGQRQRIALARALAGAPRVLILDEATSALDVVTESLVEDNLRRLPITRIVIAHRLSTIADADHLIVLDGGRIVEQGSPKALVSHDGRYAAMVHADRHRSVANPALLRPTECEPVV